MGVQDQFLNKWMLCMQNLTKEWSQPPAVILQQANFGKIFILCLWLIIITRSDQGVQFMNFPSKIFFNDINHGYKAALLKKSSLWLLSFHMDLASYRYYEKAHRTMKTATASYLLKHFYYFSAAEPNNILSQSFCSGAFIVMRVIMEIAMMKILNNCISGWLNNNYFPLNESSSLY